MPEVKLVFIIIFYLFLDFLYALSIKFLSSFKKLPAPPSLNAVISAIMDNDISSGVLADKSNPIGECILQI